MTRIIVIHSGVWLQFAVICLVLFFWKWPLRTHGFYKLYVIGFTKQVLFKTPQEFLCDYAGNVPLTVQFSIDQNYHEWCNFQICLIVKFHSVQIISIGCYNKNNSKLVIKRHHCLRCGIVCTQFICSLSISIRKKNYHCFLYLHVSLIWNKYSSHGCLFRH